LLLAYFSPIHPVKSPYGVSQGEHLTGQIEQLQVRRSVPGTLVFVARRFFGIVVWPDESGSYRETCFI
jgi:hypothetical protein